MIDKHWVDLGDDEISLVIDPLNEPPHGAPVTPVTTTDVAMVDGKIVAVPLSSDEARALLRALINLYPLDALSGI